MTKKSVQVQVGTIREKLKKLGDVVNKPEVEAIID